MRKRRIIPAKVSITRKGEIQYFQVRIPFDATSLIGIETAMRIRSSSADLPDGRKSLAGELKLQSSDDSNVFYSTTISDNTVREGLDPAPASDFIPASAWTHSNKREVEEIRVDAGTTILAGLYKDKLGDMLGFDVAYDVFVYLWYSYEKSDFCEQLTENSKP